MRWIIPGVLLAFGTVVFAEERLWVCTDDGGGVFEEPLCWEDEITPASEDTIVFENPMSFPPGDDGPYTVQFTESGAADRLIVRSGLVTLDQPNNSFILLNTNPSTPSVVVGETLTANAMMTVITRGFEGRNVTIGKGAGTLGVLDITLDSIFADFEVTNTLVVGDEGIGLLSVQDSPATEVSLLKLSVVVVGRETGSFGQVHVSDIDITGGVIGPWTIGQNGAGAVTIENSIIDTGSMALGLQAGGYGAITVMGIGSELNIEGTLDVGVLGQGVVHIEDGAFLHTQFAATLGSIDGSQPAYGEVTIEGAGTLWDAGGSVNVGGGGIGLLTASSGGRVSISGDLNRGPAPQNQVNFELGSAGDYLEAAIAVSGTTADFDATVRLVGGYEPADGDSFLLASATGSLGVFTFNDLPELTAPLIWQVDQDGLTLTLSVIDPGREDVDGSGVIDIGDLLAVILQWGPCPAPPAPCPADVNSDGTVDIQDLLLILLNWGDSA